MKLLQGVNDIYNSDTLLLYHGSRGGIKGEIEPHKNRRRKFGYESCDFGSGFYMGNSPYQAQALVSNDDNPFFYVLELNVSAIPKNRILVLEEKDWLLAVLSNRKQCEDFNNLKIAKKWIEKMKDYDLIVGLIADDSMEIAMKNFMQNNITDKGLYESLKAVDIGIQVVAKTKFACKQIEILEENRLFGNELLKADELAHYTRRKGKGAFEKCKMQYKNKGMTLEEIIEHEKEYSKTKYWRE